MLALTFDWDFWILNFECLVVSTGHCLPSNSDLNSGWFCVSTRRQRYGYGLGKYCFSWPIMDGVCCSMHSRILTISGDRVPAWRPVVLGREWHGQFGRVYLPDNGEHSEAFWGTGPLFCSLLGRCYAILAAPRYHISLDECMTRGTSCAVG